MAFDLVQEFKFENLDYSYDRRGDVLDISFVPPAPAVALQVEDWLAIQVRLNPPSFQGMTIIGFRTIFEKINQYMERELPHRMKRLAAVKLSFAYDNESDTFVMRCEEGPRGFHGLMLRIFRRKREKPSIFEPLAKAGALPSRQGTGMRSLQNIYVEKSLPSKQIIGIKILEYTKCGPAAFEGFLGAIVDTVFEPSMDHDENIHLITNLLMQHLDWQKVAAVAS